MATCPRCGKQVATGVLICSYCGASLDAVKVPTVPSVWGVAPRGVAVIGWAQELLGVLAAAIGVIGLLAGATASAAGFLLLGVLFIGAGVALFYFGYSLRRAKAWAWKFDVITLGIILAATAAFSALAFSAAPLVLVGIMALFMLYLLTPGVRHYFRNMRPS